MKEYVVNVRNCEKGWKNNEQYVFIGRGSKWGNPFFMKDESKRDEVIEKYKKYCIESGLAKDVSELKGKILVCFCKPKRCHGDVLLEMLNHL
ncbi:DUF4326 domain-containing protein [Bacteroides sp.]|uniref:DUF4326 domain-containing protein n=1 Tax=Bacteroides sp. TaxID=29523 RepID=UPI002632092F|nr:DUF4326 domain-containing protein [Bacteroides sp.]MDD3039048.1 DUF4326 domain-containing protein [Bacteroides sp.]